MLMLRILLANQMMKRDENNDNTTLTGGGDDAGGGDDSANTTANVDGGTDNSATFKGDWYEGTEQDVYDDPSLSAFKGDDGKINGTNLLKSYVHGQKNMGADRVIIPGECFINSPCKI